MVAVRTTIMMEEVLKKRVDEHVAGKGESLTDFYNRAIVNQLENEGDFEVRDLLKGEQVDGGESPEVYKKED